MAETQPEVWGVSVADVQALAPHVSVLSGENPARRTDPDYDLGVQAYTTEKQVRQFIVDVASRVAGFRLSLAVVGDEFLPALDALSADAVKNGAAAYLVDAAHPARAGVNDSASYGMVLWRRYEQALEALEAAVDRLTGVGEDGVVPGVVIQPSGQFPAPAFPDTGWR